MDEAAHIIEAASQMPLKDAAYSLWVNRHDIDRLEQPAPSETPRSHSLADWETQQVLVEIEAQLRYERENAQSGPTFDRLRRAHSEESDAELQDAIRAALKLQADCERCFQDVREAHWRHVESRRANADFPEGYDPKYDSHYFLMQTMDFPEGWGFDRLEAIGRAIELAKAENPGFQETTYQDAWHRLEVATRF